MKNKMLFVTLWLHEISMASFWASIIFHTQAEFRLHLGGILANFGLNFSNLCNLGQKYYLRQLWALKDHDSRNKFWVGFWPNPALWIESKALFFIYCKIGLNSLMVNGEYGMKNEMIFVIQEPFDEDWKFLGLSWPLAGLEIRLLSYGVFWKAWLGLIFQKLKAWTTTMYQICVPSALKFWKQFLLKLLTMNLINISKSS